MSVEIRVFNPEEMEDFMFTKEKEINFNDFTYFSFKNAGNHFRYKHFYFVAFEGEQIVGVIKLSYKDYLKYPTLWSVSWIDVSKKHRNKGISKSLYHALNDWVEEDMIIIGTLADGDGVSYNTQQTRMNIISRCQVYKTEFDLPRN